MSRTPPLSIVPVLLLLLLLLLPRSASANAAPPGDLRFDFVYETSRPVRLEGAQLITCQESPCTRPVLLGVFGKCTDPRCLPLPPAGREPGYPERPVRTMECSQERCLADVRDGYGRFYLILQFSDGARESRLFESTSEPYVVRVQDEGVIVRSPLADPYGLLFVLLFFWPALLFTVGVEALVLVLLLRRLALSRRLLLWLVPIHLATVPLVWFFFPLFSWSPTLEARLLWPLPIAALALLGIAIALYRRGNLSPRLALLLLVAGGIMFPVFLYLDMGEVQSLPALDLPVDLITLLAEATIFLIEAGIWWAIGRGRLSLPLAALLSLIANGASYGGGLLFINLLQRL